MFYSDEKTMSLVFCAQFGFRMVSGTTIVQIFGHSKLVIWSR
jgi:hypothetical protein